MKYSVEQQIIAARPLDSASNTSFVAQTMAAIKAASVHKATASVLEHAAARQKGGLLKRLRALPTAALVALIVASVIAFGGVVYAAVQLAPAVVKIFSKDTSQRGTTEYNVPSFSACVNGGKQYPTDKFELNKDAPRLSDTEIEKTLQARCELSWIDDFVSKTWPTYGTHKTWQDGDTIYYTRPDMLGTLKSLSPNAAAIATDDTHTINYTAQKGQRIVAYADGKQVSLDALHPGDAVFTVARVAETYHNPPKADGGNPQPQGMVAIIKLGLPVKYYGSMQRYLTSMPGCDGNPGEYCPGTPSIDVFPREGGEGASNHAFVQNPDGTFRMISGKVTTLHAGSLTLTSSSGKLYTITTPGNDFNAYNTTYAPAYTEMDATLKIGSTVMVTYVQAPGADPQTITPDQIQRVALQLDGSFPKKSVKQY